MRIVSLSHVVNVRLTTDVPAALDRRLGRDKWHYVEWEEPQLGLARSPLANPYSCGEPHSAQTAVSTLDLALRHYRQWLWSAIQAEESPVLALLRSLTDDYVLVTHRDGPSHAGIIARAAKWLGDQEAMFAPRTPEPRLLRERPDSETSLILFDLDQGYLKVSGKDGSRCFGLHDWVWPYEDSTPALVREDGSMRHTTTGALVALLTRRVPVSEPEVAVPLEPVHPVAPLHPSVETVRQRYAAETTVLQRVHCLVCLEDFHIPSELLLLSDGSVLDVTYDQHSDEVPASVNHYPVGGIVDAAFLIDRLTTGQEVQLSGLTYHPV